MVATLAQHDRGNPGVTGMVGTGDPDIVSIITPSWNAVSYVGATIASVQAQTCSNWELLIADDCSTDDTCGTVAAAAERDERIQLIPLSRNGGPAHARNEALGRARGRWIAFLDSDDLWLPEKLKLQLAFHQESGAHISFTGYRRMSADSQRIGRLIDVPRQMNYFSLLDNTAIATSTVMVDRFVAGNFEMKPIYFDDFGCWLALLRSGGFAVGLPQDLMRYRVVAGSVSRNKWRSAREVWKTYRQVEGLGPLRSGWHFSRYAVNALAKYSRF